MERQPSFFRIVGGSAEQKEALVAKADKHASASGPDIFGEELVMPTGEEKDLIDRAVLYANDQARHYGSDRVVDPQRVFVLREGGVYRYTNGDLEGGVQNSLKQSIGVERNPSPILFAMTVVHEACHGAAYSAGQIGKDGKDGPYRSGISMRGRNGEGYYFKMAEEAIVSIFARKFRDEVLVQDPRYQTEIILTEQIKQWLENYIQKMVPAEKIQGALEIIDDIDMLPDNESVYEVIFSGTESDEYKFGFFAGRYEEFINSKSILRERKMERDKFKEVMREIVSHSDGLLTEDDLFEYFARAHFTGNYLPLARLVESIMGKGSFREIAIGLGFMSKESRQ